jgi:hypothetical protein
MHDFIFLRSIFLPQKMFSLASYDQQQSSDGRKAAKALEMELNKNVWLRNETPKRIEEHWNMPQKCQT